MTEISKLLEIIEDLKAQVEALKAEQEKTPEQRIEEKLDQLITAVKSIQPINITYTQQPNKPYTSPYWYRDDCYINNNKIHNTSLS